VPRPANRIPACTKRTGLSDAATQDQGLFGSAFPPTRPVGWKFQASPTGSRSRGSAPAWRWACGRWVAPALRLQQRRPQPPKAWFASRFKMATGRASFVRGGLVGKAKRAAPTPIQFCIPSRPGSCQGGPVRPRLLSVESLRQVEVLKAAVRLPGKTMPRGRLNNLRIAHPSGTNRGEQGSIEPNAGALSETNKLFAGCSHASSELGDPFQATALAVDRSFATRRSNFKTLTKYIICHSWKPKCSGARHCHPVRYIEDRIKRKIRPITGGPVYGDKLLCRTMPQCARQ